MGLTSHLLHGHVPGCHGDRILCSHGNKHLPHRRAALDRRVYGLLQLGHFASSDTLVRRDDGAGLGWKCDARVTQTDLQHFLCF